MDGVSTSPWLTRLVENVSIPNHTSIPIGGRSCRKNRIVSYVPYFDNLCVCTAASVGVKCSRCHPKACTALQQDQRFCHRPVSSCPSQPVLPSTNAQRERQKKGRADSNMLKLKLKLIDGVAVALGPSELVGLCFQDSDTAASAQPPAGRKRNPLVMADLRAVELLGVLASSWEFQPPLSTAACC